MPLQGMLVEDVVRDIKEAKIEDWMTTPAGQAIVGITSVKSVTSVINDVSEEALELFSNIYGNANKA